MNQPAPPTIHPLDADTLREWPLPELDGHADKEDRGRVLVIAGSRELPGAALLAATAALRTGAGKLVVGTTETVAQNMAFALPEARVVALPETADGGIAAQALQRLDPTLSQCSAVLVGPGLMDRAATQRLVAALLARVGGKPVLLDALAMDILLVRERFDHPVLLTPHAGEMAHLTGLDKDAITRDPLGIACAAARRWNAVVALKGPVTAIATPAGPCWRHEIANHGLATSGSGDTLAGAIAGLAARGASLEQAAAWGVVLHAQAGQRLSASLGPVGFLARELPDQMLASLRELDR